MRKMANAWKIAAFYEYLCVVISPSSDARIFSPHFSSLIFARRLDRCMHAGAHDGIQRFLSEKKSEMESLAFWSNLSGGCEGEWEKWDIKIV